ncbi:MAG: T9SS type A sorting domain-containing protein [Bacteroidota bacterium]|nr:T9SS type A sorting domain-containing protein [Bacteroidota bacterium]
MTTNKQPASAHKNEILGRSDAYRSFEWWYAQRALPFEMIPQSSYQKAVQYLKGTMRKSQIGVQKNRTDQWTSLGPYNIGGRVLALAINPTNINIIWAGAASGGLWKSTTGGMGSGAWSYINTGYNTVSVSAIAIDPLSPNVMYIGTGEISLYHRPLVGTPGARASYGMGILKSTDAGMTWNQTGLTWTYPEITAIQKIVINPLNPQTIFTATSEGVYKSTNAGSSWIRSNSVLMAMDIAMSPNDTSMLVASHGSLNSSPNPGLYKTTNAGASWFQLISGLPTTNFGRTALTISQSIPSIIYAGISDGGSGGMLGLYKSTNSGSNWILVNNANYVGTQGWYNNVIALHPTDPNTIYCAGIDIHKSTDGGVTLPEISGYAVHVDHHAIAFEPTNPSIVYFGTDGGVYKTTNGGQSWINCNSGFITTQFYPGFANAFDDSTIAIGGLQDNGTLKFYGTQYWSEIFGGDGGWCAIDQTNKNVMYYQYQYLNVYKSTNGGLSAFSATNGLPTGSGNTNFISPIVISPSTPNILYAGSNNVYKTTNGGTLWFASNGQTTLNGTNIACIGVAWVNPNIIIAATGTGTLGSIPRFEIFASANGGSSWDNVTRRLNGSDSLPNRYPTDIEFDPTNNAVAYLTYSGYGTSHVFKTTNYGQYWTDISANLPDIPHQAVIVDPESPENIYVGTDLGIFYSSNGGVYWGEFNDGMPPAMVLDLTISRANGKLRASTFGNGVYERKLVRQPLLSLLIPNGGEIWVGGYEHTIMWSQKFLNYVKLEYSTNNGINWNLIAEQIPAPQGSYTWSPPLVSTTDARIKISDSNGGDNVDSSNSSFTIILNPDLYDGWNLISLHLFVSDSRTKTLFPSSVSQAFAYLGSYTTVDTLLVGNGYWLKFSQPQFINIFGDSITSDTIDVSPGWNMIGSISSNVSTNSIVELPTDIVTSRYFGYRQGYKSTDTLHPKKGYWVKVISSGKLVFSKLNQYNIQSTQKNKPTTFNVITIRDTDDNQQTLYFTSQYMDDISFDDYELPPIPPAGSFDVRFQSGRMLVKVEQESAPGGKEYPILIQSDKYPVSISWELKEANQTTMLIIDGYTIILSQNGATEIYNPRLTDGQAKSDIKLRLSSTLQKEIPEEFILFQNYPNPFNPRTNISFKLHVSGFMSLKVYDILGKEVAILVNEKMEAGEHEVEWNAEVLTSGVYFCKLDVGKFTEIRKLLLLR